MKTQQEQEIRVSPIRSHPPRYVARVIDVIQGEGEKLPYVVTICPGFKGTVTFTLVPGIWLETEEPRRADTLLIWEMRCVSGSWRAYKARFLKPEDPEGADIQLL